VSTTCLTCRHLNGCEILRDSKGIFILERIITEDSDRNCSDYIPVGERETAVRSVLANKFGIGALRGINKLHQMVLEDEELESMEESVDFESLIKEGMTTEERKDQLRFETDDAGDTKLDKDGNPKPRLTFTLRKYATDPEGPVREPPDKVLFWTAEQLITVIVKAELEEGLLIKSSKSKKSKASKTSTKKKEESDMAAKKVKRRVIVRGKGKGAVPRKAGGEGAEEKGGKVASPPTGKRKRRSKKAKEAAEEKPQVEETTEAPAFDVEALKEEIVGDLKMHIDKKLEEAVNAIEANLDAFRQRNSENLTSLHDVLLGFVNDKMNELVIQIAGTDEELEEFEPMDVEEKLLWPDETTIDSYLDSGEDEGE